MRQIKDFFNHDGTISPQRIRRADKACVAPPKNRLNGSNQWRVSHLLKDKVIGPTPVPILKYTLLVGASLLAIIISAGYVMEPAPGDAAMKQSSSSLELLRKMANHGESKPFASAAAAGPFHAMPTIAALPLIAESEPVQIAKPLTIGTVVPPAALNAQARLAESDVSDKPSRPIKRVVTRKPKPRFDYVENVPRNPGGFFGAFQSW